MNAQWPRRWPWGLLVAMVAVAMVESAVARRTLFLSRYEGVDWRLSRRLATQATQGRDVLCFGSSLMANGVLPAALEQGSGLSARNLAVVGGNLFSSNACLDQALRAGARPSAVLLEVHPSALTRSYQGNEPNHVDILDFQECLELARATRNPTLLGNFLTHRPLRSLHLRHEIRAAVLSALKGETHALILTNIVHARNRRANQGSTVNARGAVYRGEVVAEYRHGWLDNPGLRQAHPDGLALLDRFLGKTAARGIRVYWVIFPLAPELQRLRENSLAESVYLDVARRALAKYPHLVVVDGRHAATDLSLYHDAIHLNPWGAAALSRGVAPLLTRAPGESRWVELPAMREAPLDVAVELSSATVEAVRETARRLRR